MAALFGAGGKLFKSFTGNRISLKRERMQITRDWFKDHKRKFANKQVDTKAGPLRFDSNGWPDYTQYLHPGKNTARIQLTGDRKWDIRLAETQLFGKTGTTPAGYTWHHHQRLGTMQLVRQDAHTPGFGGRRHDGGAALFNKLYGWGYEND